ncbi:MAG TPA: glycosyltransferase family 4 protein [Chitinophagaceae bacterium]|nr:glycosyltransferase family 4 protein [Chitinophagaceae bacterium]
MKKVLLSAYACSPIRGSEPGNGWTWAVNIANLGYEVWCITNIEDKEITEAHHQKLGLKNLHFIFIPVPFGLDKYLLDTSSKKIYFHYLLWRRRGAAIALKLHKENKFDIAHHVTFGSLQLGTCLWKLRNINLVFGPIGGGQKALPAFKEYFGKAWKIEKIRNVFSRLTFYFSKGTKETLKRARHILVTNKDTELLIKQKNSKAIAKVHFMLDNAVPESMENLPHVEKNYQGCLKLLWVGRMLPRKGLNLVLHALSKIPDSVPYQLTIVGGGEQFQYLHEWIRKYKLDPQKIKIVGQIPFSDVIKHYQESEVFIFCSLRDSCPAQISEAMAFGLPPIVLDLHGSALAVPDNCGIKVKVTTPEETAAEIAKAVISLYENKNQLALYSKASITYSKVNTWKKKAEYISANYY